jgi:hypothetical protein
MVSAAAVEKLYDVGAGGYLERNVDGIFIL